MKQRPRRTGPRTPRPPPVPHPSLELHGHAWCSPFEAHPVASEPAATRNDAPLVLYNVETRDGATPGRQGPLALLKSLYRAGHARAGSPAARPAART
jgi:hypothetical protein